MKIIEKNNSLLSVAIVLVVMLTVIIALYCQQSSAGQNMTDAMRANEQSLYNFLVLGRDNSAGLCDVIILASINFDSGAVNVMQIPRDTYFDIDRAHKKINSIQSVLDSAELVASVLGEAMSIKIDYYLSLNLDTLSSAIDAMNGIEIDVPFDMEYTDNSQNLSISLKKGKQLLDGKSAVGFLRYRSGYITGDLGRVNAQKLFLNAFFNKMGQLGNPFAIYRASKLVLDSSDTNLKEQDMIALGLRCAKVKNATISYLTAPGDAIQDAQSGAWYYVLSRDSLADVLKGRFGMSVDKKDFDKVNKFVDKDDKSFYDIYKKYCEVKIYSADDVENNEVNIN